MRTGLVGVLSRFGHRIAAEVGDADSLVTAVRAHLPDIVVTDIRMPPDHSSPASPTARPWWTRRSYTSSCTAGTIRSGA